MGQGRPVVFVHGWCIHSDSWEYLLPRLLEGGFRCIVYDQRGCGRSERPYMRYDYALMAADLADLLGTLALREVLLVGHSLGCSVIAEYLATYGRERVEKIVFMATNTPYLALAADNPEGLPPALVEEQIVAIKKDRAAYVRMIAGFYLSGSAPETTVSADLTNWGIGLTMQAAAYTAVDMLRVQFEADFREALTRIKLPVLLLHGEADLNAPMGLTSVQTMRYLPQAQLKTYAGGAHGFYITHAAQIGNDLLTFFLT